MEKEIESEKIGEMVIKRLRKLDEIAYVRFASVYRQFKDINEFKSELNKLLDNQVNGKSSGDFVIATIFSLNNF